MIEIRVRENCVHMSDLDGRISNCVNDYQMRYRSEQDPRPLYWFVLTVSQTTYVRLPLSVCCCFFLSFLFHSITTSPCVLSHTPNVSQPHPSSTTYNDPLVPSGETTLL